MLMLNVTGKPFVISLLLDEQEGNRRKSLGDSTGDLQCFCSCRQAEKVWVQGAVSRTRSAEIFGNAARCFLSTRVPCCRWMQDWAVPLCLEWGRALKQRVSWLVSPCLAAVASPDFPPLCPSDREQKQDCARERSRSEKEGSSGRGAPRFREETGPCYSSCFVGF